MRNCKQPLMADIYRDGGSYGFVFRSDDGKTYEFHLKVVHQSPADCRRYFEPLVFLDNCNSGEVVEHPTWDEAKDFISKIKFKNERFNELSWIVQNRGWDAPKGT